MILIKSLIKTTQFKALIWSFYYWKRILFCEILAVNAHESKPVSCCTQLLLQALDTSRLATTGRNLINRQLHWCPTVENSKIVMNLEVVRHQCTVHGLALKVTCLNNERTRGHFVTFARFARSVTFWVPTLNCKQYSNHPKTFPF